MDDRRPHAQERVVQSTGNQVHSDLLQSLPGSVGQAREWLKVPMSNVAKQFLYDIVGPDTLKKKLLLRRWKYQDNVNEFYVITDESTTIKLAELEKQLEATEVDATCPFQDGDPGDELSLGWLQWGFKSIAPKIPIVPKKKPTLNIYICIYI